MIYRLKESGFGRAVGLMDWEGFKGSGGGKAEMRHSDSPNTS